MGATALGRIGATLVLVVAGILFVASARTSAGTDLRAGRYTDLPDLVRAQSRESDVLAGQAAALGAEVDTLTAAQDDPAVTALRARASALEPAAGLTAVQGPGVTVSLDDAPLPESGSLRSDTTYDDYVVHQQDVEGVLNALWSGGADAVSIMDQRLVSTSAVRCVGNVLVLQGRVYSPPFRIAAVGDPARLQRALDGSGAVSVYRDWASYLGLGYDVRVADPLTIPAYDGSTDLAWAGQVSP